MAGVASKVLFLRNEHLATEALLGEAFAEQGFDVEMFEVVPAHRIDDPAGDVTFPDPTGYDVIVPLGARWPVYDDALRRSWVSTEMQLVRDAADAGVALLGVCFGGQLLAQAFGGSVARSSAPEIGWYDVTSDKPDLIPGGPWFQWHFDRWTPASRRHRGRPNRQRITGVRARPCARTAVPPGGRRRSAGRCGWPTTRDGEVVGFGLTHDELRSRTTELAQSASARVRDLVRGFVTHVVRQPCPSS